jgi:CDGSH-type Zn-finger protein
MSEETTIKAAPNGPYLVTNCQVLENRSDGNRHESKGTIALCRCGASKNKPFCDGTHAKIGFSDEKSADRLPDKRDEYRGQRITIHDNRGLCAHAATCTDGLKSVFRLKQEPWIDPDGADVDAVVATVRSCPSGALSYSLEGVEHRDAGGEPMILIVPNGPYAVRGGARLERAEMGDGASRDHFTLCRCGQSKNKPFCDGAHWNHHVDEHAPAPGEG